MKSFLAVFEEERRGAGLSGGVTALDVRGVHRREVFLAAERRVPAIGERNQARIELLAQVSDELRQGIREVLVLAAAVAVTLHDDAAPEERVLRVEAAQAGALGRREKAVEDGSAVGVERARDDVPVAPGEARVEPCTH